MPSVQRPLEDVALEISQTLRNKIAQAELQASVDELLEALRSGESLAALAKEKSLTVETLEAVNRRENRAPRIVPAAFALNVNGEGYGSVPMGYQGIAVMVVSDVVPGTLASLSEAEQQGLRGLLQQAAAGAELNAYQASLRANASVVIQ
jgi:hypothetical protein